MKKARILLFFIGLCGLASASLSLKAVKRSIVVYYTTTIYNAICTITLTHATTTNMFGKFRYYTFDDNQRCTRYSYVTNSNA